jgi:hypothetical protein
MFAACNTGRWYFYNRDTEKSEWCLQPSQFVDTAAAHERGGHGPAGGHGDGGEGHFRNATTPQEFALSKAKPKGERGHKPAIVGTSQRTTRRALCNSQ